MSPTAPTPGLYAGWLSLALGAAVLLIVGLGSRRFPWHHFLAFIVPAVTTLSYTTLIFEQGVTVLSDGRVYDWARWLDACFGATLLLINTALIALPPTRSAPERGALLTGIATASVLTMFTGLLAGASVEPAPRWTWYLIGSGSYGAALWLLFVRVPDIADRLGISEVRQSAYSRALYIIAGVSMLYPLWWLATPAGFDLVGRATQTWGFTLLDVLSKVAYPVYLLRSVHRINPVAESATESTA